MLLADGRRILPRGIKSDSNEADIIRLHPDFRMIVLANRPGFPFLGNDFFASLGNKTSFMKAFIASKLLFFVEKATCSVYMP